MTEPQKDNIPIIAALVAVLVLLAVGGYLFWRADTGGPTGSENAAAAEASADRALKIAGMTDDERKATEAVVRSYILENPELITEAIEILQQRQVAGRINAAGSTISKPFYSAEAGNPDGDVTVVEFTDYNCGFCKSSVADVERLIAGDKGVRLVYREAPILSVTSRDAALWALAAARQGKHQAFHKAMFGAGRPDATTITAAATQAGLNLAAAQKFVATPEAVAEVEGNLALMQQLGLSSTPTFIIGDRILEGALGYDALKIAVAKARERN